MSVAPHQEAASVLEQRPQTTADAEQFFWAKRMLKGLQNCSKPSFSDELVAILKDCKTVDDTLVVDTKIAQLDGSRRAHRRWHAQVEARRSQLRRRALAAGARR